VAERRLRYLVAEARCYWCGTAAGTLEGGWPLTPGTLMFRRSGIGIGKPWQVQPSTEGPFVVAGSCFYWLHTHTGDGIIHIESPVQRTFTLGDFFAIWGQPLSSSQAASATGPVIAYVNGERSSGDPSQIALQAHQIIQLDVGDETPPRPFMFPPGL
jgi:hypothetical protein